MEHCPADKTWSSPATPTSKPRGFGGALLAEALALTARHEKRFIIGGASIYREALALVDTIFLTLIDADFPEADTRLPELRLEDWLTEIGDFTPADERNDFPTVFLTLHRPD